MNPDRLCSFANKKPRGQFGDGESDGGTPSNLEKYVTNQRTSHADKILVLYVQDQRVKTDRPSEPAWEKEPVH